MHLILVTMNSGLTLFTAGGTLPYSGSTYLPMKHTAKTRERVRWMPDKDTERNGLQTLLAFAYGMQVGRSRRLAVELQGLRSRH